MDIAQKRSHGLSRHPWKSIVPHVLCLHHLHTCHSPSWGWRGHCLSLKTLLSTHLKYFLLNTSEQKISIVLSSKDGHKILTSHTCKLQKLKSYQCIHSPSFEVVRPLGSFFSCHVYQCWQSSSINIHHTFISSINYNL